MAEAEFISAEHSNHFRGIRGALAPHGTGPTIIGPMISKIFIAAQGSFLYFHAVVGPSSGGAHPVEDVHSMWISLLCQGETARQGCRALRRTRKRCAGDAAPLRGTRERRIRDAAGMLENAVPHIAEWDESAIRQLVAQVKVLSKNEISVTLKSGIEIRQSISN